MSQEQKERIDDLQRGGCRIIQRPALFCFGMDAVLLSAWAQVKRGDRVLDLCSGNGIVPILMDARLPEELRQEGSIHFTGVEIQPVCVDLARRSALMNGPSGRIRFLEGLEPDGFLVRNIDSALVLKRLGSSRPVIADYGIYAIRHIALSKQGIGIIAQRITT